jgi:hypothetical protein
MRSGYTRAEAALVCDVSEKQVRELSRAGGPVAAALKAASGRGSLVLFDAFDLVKLAVLGELAGMLGVDLRGRWVSQTARALEVMRGARLDGSVLVLDDQGARVSSRSATEGALARSRIVVLVDIADVHERLHARIQSRLGVLSEDLAA